MDELRGDEARDETATDRPVRDLAIPLERDLFLRTLIRELAGTLESVVGLEEASGYISVVGAAVGEGINADYRRALGVPALSRGQVRDVLLDLKRRIRGDFYVIEETADRLVVGNRACPFGTMVAGRRSMCMMTSNVFGHIAAENLGYGKVELRRTIAAGDRECVVAVHFTLSDEAQTAEGREYVRAGE